MPNVLMPSTPMRRRDGVVEGATVDGGRNPANSPVDMVGRLSHYLTWFYTSKRWLFSQVVGNGISEPSTV